VQTANVNLRYSTVYFISKLLKARELTTCYSDFVVVTYSVQSCAVV